MKDMKARECVTGDFNLNSQQPLHNEECNGNGSAAVRKRSCYKNEIINVGYILYIKPNFGDKMSIYC